MLRFSKKVEYALMAVKHIAESDGDLVTAKEVSEKYEIPYELLAKILQSMKKSGILTSEQGIRGGYKLLKKTDEISLSEFICSVDGDEPTLVDCVNSDGKTCCNKSESCTIKEPMLKMQKELEELFNRKTISDFV